jgi:hypothetical protein
MGIFYIFRDSNLNLQPFCDLNLNLQPVYWFLVAFFFGGILVGVQHHQPSAWKYLVLIETDELSHPLTPLSILPRATYPLLFLLYTTYYSFSKKTNPALHLPVSLAFFAIGYFFWQLTSAPGTGQPNNAEKWLKQMGLVGESFGFSLKTAFLLGLHLDENRGPKSKYIVSIHLHHWFYLLVINFCIFLFRHHWFFLEHRLIYWAIIAANMGGVAQGLKYADWSNVLSVEAVVKGSRAPNSKKKKPEPAKRNISKGEKGT